MSSIEDQVREAIADGDRERLASIIQRAEGHGQAGWIANAVIAATDVGLGRGDTPETPQPRA